MKLPLKVSDIAQPDTTTQFISDVQLSTFHDAPQLNRDLMQRFMFTKGSGDRTDRKGTAELLKVLHQRVTPLGEKEDNRFVFMATYGHGKSHFGLALANFFGAEQGSPELEAIFGKLDYSLPKDQLQMLRDFRAGKNPFLVLILRGDRPGSLRDMFFQALDRALSKNEQTKDLKPPFWFERADEILERLESKAADAKVANKYLAAHSLDLPGLRQLVRERQSRAFNLSVGAFEAVYRVQPNLGGETALSDAVQWIVTELCGPGKPFGGLLVLFDEFSRFVQDYIQNNPIGAPLQELLSGIGNPTSRGKALFIGLSQHDPNVIAERYGASEELIKELNRLPDSNRHRMQTMLEDVLGGVLKTDERAWKALNSDPRVGIKISEAADTALALFADRYGPKQLGWNLSTIMDKVAKQCFPLHPLTTAFLASVTLQSTGTVRSVLGFIQDKDGFVMPRFDEPAVTESGQPNWVLPTRLVDYFGEALNEEKYKNYKNVVKPDLTEAQQAVLKAMLLLDVAELSTKRAGGYAAVVANLTGLEEKDARDILQVLEEQHYIRYDSVNKTYSFWVGSNDALTLDRILSEAVAQREEKRTLGQLFETFTGGTNPVNRLGLTEKHPVAVTWGHPDDWGAQEVLVPASGLNASLLAALRTKYTAEIDKAPEARGVVVLVVPKTQKEANEAAEKINALLSVSEKDKTAPLLFLVPQEAHGDLHTQLLKLALLSDPVFKSQAQAQVGPSALTEMTENLKGRVSKTLTALRQQSALLLPPSMAAAWAARAKPNLANRLGEALKTVYELAYPYHPDSFFTQYKLSAPTLSKASVDVLYELLDNSLDSVKWSAGAKVPHEVVKVLQKDWKIVSPQQQIMEPEFTKVKAAWDRFEGTFSPKIKSAYADAVLLELLQPPYGYDQNTLALLFAAWIGRNRDAISLSGVGKLSRPLEGSKTAAFKSPGVFLKAMSAVPIHRKDIAGDKAKVAAVLAQLKDGVFELAEAKRAVLTLQEFRDNNPRYDADYLEQVESALNKLLKGLENQTNYEKAVDTFETKLGQAKSVSQLKPLFDALKSGFPSLSVVKSGKPTLDELNAALLARAETMAEKEIAYFAQLKDIGQYGVHVGGLRSLATILSQLDLKDLKAKAAAGLGQLDEAKNELEARQVEAAEVSVVNSISVTGSLADLRGSLAALMKLDSKSKRASELADWKYEQLKQNISALEGKLEEWEAALGTVLDSSAANKLSNELLSQSAKYEGAKEAERVTALGQQAASLSRYFSVLSQATPLYDPADVRRRTAELHALGEEYAGKLTPEQQDRLGVALSELAEKQADEEAKAAAWLAQQQARLAQGDTQGLEKVLNSPPRFLSENGHEALNELRRAVLDLTGREQQEAQQLKFVQSLTPTGSVLTLQNRLSELEKLAPVTPKVQEAVTQRREEISAEVARLLSLPEQWEAALAEAKSAQVVSQLAKDLARQEAHLRGTEHEENVAALASRIETVQGLLRRADDLRHNSSTRLRDLTERRTEQEEISRHAHLSPAQQQLLSEDAARTGGLFEAELGKLDARLSNFQDKLSAVQSLSELDKVELASFPRAGLPDGHLSRLQALEGQRDALRPLLGELAALGQQLWRDIGEAQSLLRQYTTLLDAPVWSERQRQMVEGKRTSVLENLKGKRQEASAWLSEREAALPNLDARGLGQLERELARPHPFLDATEQGRLGTLRAGLQARLEEDQALQIETLFGKIESPERRAALLARLQQLVTEETV